MTFILNPRVTEGDKERMAMTHWAILVIWHDGQEEYLKEGTRPALFFNRNDAVEHSKFMRIGMEGECQSVNIVPYPKVSRVTDERLSDTRMSPNSDNAG